MPNSIDSHKRIYGLDVLRALAILFVVFEHGNYLLPDNISKQIELFLFDGVGFFFILSGFLIGRILIKNFEKHGISVPGLINFWNRRWMRTLPSYFLILGILTAYQLCNSETFQLKYVVRYLFFLQNFFKQHPGFFPEAWSLSIEEWFYLILPSLIFLLLLVRVSVKTALIYGSILIIVGATVFRAYRFGNVDVSSPEIWDYLFRKQVSTRMDSLMYGVIGAYISHYHPVSWLKNKGLLFMLGLVAVIVTRYLPIEYDSVYKCVFAFSIEGIAILFMLPMLSNLNSPSALLSDVVTTIALISYPMYLINLSLVQKIILPYIAWPSSASGIAARYLAYWCLTILGSLLIHRLIEKPVLRMRDRKSPDLSMAADIENKIKASKIVNDDGVENSVGA